MYAIIRADEVGDKLWPVTCEELPKAFLPVYSDNTLLEETLLRVMPFLDSGDDVFITVPENSVEALLKQDSLSAFSIPEKNLIKIPKNKGSLWAIMAGCQRVKRKNKHELIMVMPVDQFFWPKESIIIHLSNILGLAKEKPNDLLVVCLPPGGPSPLLNYVSGKWRDVKTTSMPLDEDLAGLLNTLIVNLDNYQHKPDYEQAKTMLTGDWLWDLSTYVSSVSNIEKSVTELNQDYADYMSSHNLLRVWDKLPYASFEDTVVPHCIEKGKARGAIIPKILWSTLDNWVSIQHLLYDAGLFNSRPIEGVHLVESANNLIFKPPNKDVALFGVSNLIVIDTGDKLLIGTPGGLYDNF